MGVNPATRAANATALPGGVSCTPHTGRLDNALLGQALVQVVGGGAEGNDLFGGHVVHCLPPIGPRLGVASVPVGDTAGVLGPSLNVRRSAGAPPSGRASRTWVASASR